MRRLRTCLPWYGWLGAFLVQAYLLAPMVVYEVGGEWVRVYAPQEVARIRDATQAALSGHNERAALHRQMSARVDELLARFLAQEDLTHLTDEARPRFVQSLEEDPTYRDFQRRYRELVRRSKEPKPTIEALGADPQLPPPRWRQAEDLRVGGVKDYGRRQVWEDRLFPSALLACYRPGAWWWRLPLLEGGLVVILFGLIALRGRGLRRIRGVDGDD